MYRFKLAMGMQASAPVCRNSSHYEVWHSHAVGSCRAVGSGVDDHRKPPSLVANYLGVERKYGGDYTGEGWYDGAR